MIKGLKIRLDIHNILYSIYKHNKTLESNSTKRIINNHSEKDISFLYNVTLNSMRLHFHTLRIIKKYIKNKLRDQERILLISAITQIVFLNFKEYAVINCSVEIAKKLKLYPGLINATLKRIAKDKLDLKKINIEYSHLPNWFLKKTNNLSYEEKKHFVKNFHKEPDVHIIFKNTEMFKSFEEELVQTSSISGFLVNKQKISLKKNFKEGNWWVQDFSSFFPISNFYIKDKNIKILDACAAPGGKSFQLLSRGHTVVLNDKSSTRIKVLTSNLTRLKLYPKILNKDFTKFDINEKYDLIVIDAPCSAIGTIRKNPEIFFKNKGPDFIKLINIQQKMLDKAALLLEKNGLIVYMTCSFLECETVNQIAKFLKKSNKFELSDFVLTEENKSFSRFIKNKFMLTLPDNILRYTIDGYFAAFIKKIK